MSTFQQIIQSEKPVLIDFFAEWCGPCKMMSPILKEVKEELKDDITILKIDVDKNQRLAAQHNVRGVPTLAIFKNGQLLWRESGVFYKNDLVKVIHSFIHN